MIGSLVSLLLDLRSYSSKFLMPLPEVIKTIVVMKSCLIDN